MNSKERVLATLNRRPADRTPLDCWLYQKQFVDMLQAEYGSRDKFLDEFNIDIFTGFVPWPNQLGRKIDGLAVRAPWNDCPRPARRKRVRPLVDERFCLGCGVWR